MQCSGSFLKSVTRCVALSLLLVGFGGCTTAMMTHTSNNIGRGQYWVKQTHGLAS